MRRRVRCEGQDGKTMARIYAVEEATQRGVVATIMRDEFSKCMTRPGRE